MSSEIFRRSILEVSQAGKQIRLFFLWTPIVCEATDARQALERPAEALDFFAWQDFLHGRKLTSRAPPEKAEQYNQTISSLFGSYPGLAISSKPKTLAALRKESLARHSTQALLDLLEHKDPKVRTLAAAALFAEEDPKQLPRIRALTKDEASTFPAPQPFGAAAFLPDPQELPPMTPQTVGDIAREIIRFYMERSGYFHGIEGHGSNPGFNEYWQARQDRSHCLGWFEVQLDRATQGLSPIPPEGVARIHHIRHKVEALPPVDREMTLLALFTRPDLQPIVTEKSLLLAARRLGPDRLMRVLQNDPLVDDPDLPYRIERARNFVLRHAGHLLRPSDARRLLEIGRETREAKWFIAAAELQPSNAANMLRAAFELCRFLHGEQAETAIALWRLAGEAESPFLIHWFYRYDEPRLGRAPYRVDFTKFLLDRFRSDDRALLARIIGDERFENLDWSTLKVLVRGLNQNLLHPVVDPNEVESLRHPLGEAHFRGMPERAETEYPNETAELLAALSEWRRRIRRSVPLWPAPLER